MPPRGDSDDPCPGCQLLGLAVAPGRVVVVASSRPHQRWEVRLYGFGPVTQFSLAGHTCFVRCEVEDQMGLRPRDEDARFLPALQLMNGDARLLSGALQPHGVCCVEQFAMSWRHAVSGGRLLASWPAHFAYLFWMLRRCRSEKVSSSDKPS